MSVGGLKLRNYKNFLGLVFCFLYFLLNAQISLAQGKWLLKENNNENLIVFVHGFTGDATDTWGKFEGLLSEDVDLQDWDILFWGYPTKLFAKNQHVYYVGEALKTELKYSKRKYKNLVLIGHSMGGLVIRSYIIGALKRGEKSELSPIKKVLLFGTPNDGLLLANFSIFNRQIDDMAMGEKFIDELNKDWSRYVNSKKDDDYHMDIPVTAVIGLEDDFVTKGSVSSTFDVVEVVPGNHTKMIKPKDNSSPVYRLVSKTILDVLKLDNELEVDNELEEDKNTKLTTEPQSSIKPQQLVAQVLWYLDDGTVLNVQYNQTQFYSQYENVQMLGDYNQVNITYKLFDLSNKQIAYGNGNFSDQEHIDYISYDLNGSVIDNGQVHINHPPIGY